MPLQLLEQRIGTFVKTGEQLLADQHVHSPHIQQQIKQLQNRWDDFKKQVGETRRLINLGIKYFEAVEEVS